MAIKNIDITVFTFLVVQQQQQQNLQFLLLLPFFVNNLERGTSFEEKHTKIKYQFRSGGCILVNISFIYLHNKKGRARYITVAL